MDFIKTTEKDSNYNHLERMGIKELLKNINSEDKTVPFAVEKAIPQIEKIVAQIVPKLKSGGRLFYIGAGTSGRLCRYFQAVIQLKISQPTNHIQ